MAMTYLETSVPGPPTVWEEIGRAAVLVTVPLVLLFALVCVALVYGLTHPPRVTAGIAAARGWWIDPEDAEMTYDEWVLDRPDGVRLPVWDLDHPACPAGATIIATHCWGGSKVESLQRLEFIRDHASRIIFWDLRGHGDAEGPPASHLGVAEIEDLLDLIERVSVDDRPVILYGFSMGAGISIAAGAKDRRVAGIIADGPYRWTGEPVNSILQLNGIPIVPLTTITHRYLAHRYNLRGSDRAKFASQLTCPLMVLHGENDPITAIESAREIAEAAEDHEFVVLPDGGHLDLHLKHPQAYREAVDTFVQRCLIRTRT